jgi:hypothetical protein
MVGMGLQTHPLGAREFALCHAKLSRASRSSRAPDATLVATRDLLGLANSFSNDKILGMDAFNGFLQSLIGPDGQPKELTLLQLCLRAFIIFVLGLAMVRIGDRRSLSEKTGFDTLFLVLIAAVLARAINGSAGFLTSIGCGFFLMFVHRVFAYIAWRSHRFGKLIKGNDEKLVSDGKINWKSMKHYLVSKHDLEEDLRLSAATEDIEKIKTARLERSGDISFIKKNDS